MKRKIPRWRLYIWYNVLGKRTSPLNIIIEWGFIQCMLFGKYNN